MRMDAWLCGRRTYLRVGLTQHLSLGRKGQSLVIPFDVVDSEDLIP